MYQVTLSWFLYITILKTMQVSYEEFLVFSEIQFSEKDKFTLHHNKGNKRVNL